MIFILYMDNYLLLLFSSMEEINKAWSDTLNGVPSTRPIIEMTIPSVLDSTISPPGRVKYSFFLVNTFVQIQSPGQLLNVIK